MIPKRTNRVANLIKREISQIIQQELEDPRIGFVTITKVTVTNDLKQADVWISVLGTLEQKKDSLKTLNNAHYYIQELLAPRVKLRFLPQIHFHLDHSIEYSSHIGKIIQKLKKEENWEQE